MNPHDSLAGRWYPADPADLRTLLSRLQPESPVSPLGTLRALVLPHAGYAYSGRVAAETLALAQPAAFDRIMVLGPSHSEALPNRLAIPETASWETPLGTVPLDADALGRLQHEADVVKDDGIHAQEHSVRIQLPMLQYRLGERLNVVPVLIGQLSQSAIERFAGILCSLVTARTLVIVSSDFTHYGHSFGYVPFDHDVQDQLRELDMSIIERLLALDLAGFLKAIDRTGATVCGRHPLALLPAMLPSTVKGRLIAYDTSGRQMRDEMHSVSYAGLCFTAPTDCAG